MPTTTDDEFEPKFRTITLTGRQPVAIIESEWPELAGDHYETKDVQTQGIVAGATRVIKGWLKVRQHDDGRTLVYGGASLATTLPGERGYLYRGGEILEPTGNIGAAVGRVVDELVGLSGQVRIRELCRVVIAKLPAEVL